MKNPCLHVMNIHMKKIKLVVGIICLYQYCISHDVQHVFIRVTRGAKRYKFEVKRYNVVKYKNSPYLRRRVSSVVEHSSANPKVPGSIPGPVSYRGHGL